MSVSLIIGDLHVGKGQSLLGRPGIGSALNSRITDQFTILEWLLEQAIASNASNMIITGDVFEETKPHPTLIAMFISWLKQSTSHNIDVHIVMGNHDLIRSGQFLISALDIITAADIEGVYVHKHIDTLHTNGASFTFLPFRDRRSFNTNSNAEAISILRDKLPYEALGIPNANAKVLIGHLAIEGSIFVGDEISDASNELFCPVDMFKQYDYTWMGHVHRPQIMSKAPFVAHIGSMDLSDFGETDHSKIAILFDPDKNLSYFYLEIPSRPIKKISITVPENIGDTTEFIVNELKSNYNDLNKSVIRLNVVHSNSNVVSMNRNSIENCLNGLGAFYISKMSEEKKIDAIKKNSDTNAIDNTVNENIAIKMYADLNVDETIRHDFITLADEIVVECTK